MQLPPGEPIRIWNWKDFITTIQGKGTFVAKVEESLIRSVKIKSVQQAMEKSIESALQQNYTFEEIETIFAELIEELKMKKGGKG